MSESQIIANYNLSIDKHQVAEQALAKKSQFLSISRLLFFILLVAAVILASSYNGIVATCLGIIGFFVFLYIVKSHHKLDKRKIETNHKQRLIKNEIATITKLENDHYDGSHFIDDEHHYTSDLDVFGPFSLFRLVNRGRTYAGMHKLADYMSTTPTTEQLEKRSEVIKDLEPDIDWRIDFHTSLYEVKDGHLNNVTAIINNILNSDLSFATNSKLSLYRKVLPFIWLALGGLYFIFPSAIYILAIILGFINFRITMSYAERVTEIQQRLSQAGTYLDRYANALSKIYDRKWNSKWIKNLLFQKNKETELESKIDALSKLKNLADLLDYRLHMVPSFILNIGLLWDSKISARISDWHQNHGETIQDTFDLIGTIEALSSLASWSYNHPEHNYPMIDEKHFHLKGVDMRHPLMPKEECVANDFEVTPRDYMSIITGSNMSGKSTFLRTVGLNMILGYCGTRVAAQSMHYSIVDLITYMRIKDALEENVSTFKSELNRVVKILDLLKSSRPAFILADEILRGTNSHDKLKGSKAIVLRILQQKSYGIVATHDIALAQLSEKHAGINNFFFDIDFAAGELLFDYKIKKGICENFNASFLLGQLGLDV